MRWVQQPAIRPHRCAVIPFIGAHNATAGFIDTGQDLRDPDSHVYISVQAVEEMARFVGWTPPDVILKAKCERLERELAEAQAEVEELNREFDAIDVLASRGFQARKKPGRKAEKAPA